MAKASPQRLAADERLMRCTLESLERVGCQFFACDGPTLRPKAMKTCHVCVEIAQLRKRLGLPIKD